MDLFRGRFEVKVDQKGRLSLPAAIRQDFMETDAKLVMTNGQYLGHRCLDLYAFGNWVKLEERIGRLQPLKSEVQAFQRFYLAGGQMVEPDSQGRALLPATLRKYAGIEAQVVLVGMGEKIEIWAADIWQTIYEDLAEGFDKTLSSVSALEELAS